jgi:hypothetical protein
MAPVTMSGRPWLYLAALLPLAARVRSQERCLDEMVEDSRLSARMAESVAVEHLSRYRRARR